MKIDKDITIYIVLFSLISFEAYRDAVLKSEFQKRINSVENIVWNLTVEKGRVRQRIDQLEIRQDSLHNVYLHKQ